MTSVGFQPKTFSTPSLTKMIRRFLSPTTAWGMDSRIEASRASSRARRSRASTCFVMSIDCPSTARPAPNSMEVTDSRIQWTRPSFPTVRNS
ncbi:MAG: hypothetical protein A4E67_00589 [Syntrophaceae bacterium PtaB.Bin038]|nr:MAG: hypothetical protein A4E67_00589 [Syntrophaceae bacterium PtaB.Bin038]